MAFIVVQKEGIGGQPIVEHDVPIGGIVLWYGTIANIPSGFQVCNGTGGTPELRGKFVRGATDDSDVLDTGGAETHVHAGGGSESDGSHNHSFSFTTGGSTYNTVNNIGTTTYAPSNHTHTGSGSTGNDGGHDHSQSGNTDAKSNNPPYKRLYWIQRVT